MVQGVHRIQRGMNRGVAFTVLANHCGLYPQGQVGRPGKDGQGIAQGHGHFQENYAIILRQALLCRRNGASAPPIPRHVVGGPRSFIKVAWRIGVRKTVSDSFGMAAGSLR